MKKSILLLLAIPVLALSKGLFLVGSLSYDLASIEGSPVRTLGADLDLLWPSSGDVSMGLGLAFKLFQYTEPASFLKDPPPSYTFEIYSVASYSGAMGKEITLSIDSKGGISIPDLDLSISGYFAQVSFCVSMQVLGLDLGIGAGLKMYSFGSLVLSLVPIELRLGKVF